MKVIRLAEGAQFRNFIPRTVCCTCRPALSSVTTRWTSSPAISEQRIHTMLCALWLAAGSAQFGTAGVGLGAERRNARVHRCGFHHRTGRQDRGSLCLPRLAAYIMREQNLA